MVDTGSYYSLFGQIVIMTMFQVGGLGYMVFIVIAARIVGRLSLSNRITFQESMTGAQASLLVLVILMFIGASPGGTGGGIKTTSFGIILISLWQVFRRREAVHAFKKQVPGKVITTAFTIATLSLAVVTLASLILTVIEKAPFLNILFEVFSALGTVGLSRGITPKLSVIGKLVISATMLTGRIGPLAIGFSLTGKPEPEPYRYTEGEIYIG